MAGKFDRGKVGRLVVRWFSFGEVWMMEATTVLWLEHWPGNPKVPGSMPSAPGSVVVVSLSKELYSNCSPVPH